MKPLNLSNSIYQKNGSKFGLDVNGGMLINNAPDDIIGIKKISNTVKQMKRIEKIQSMSDAVALGKMKSDMGDCGCM